MKKSELSKYMSKLGKKGGRACAAKGSEYMSKLGKAGIAAKKAKKLAEMEEKLSIPIPSRHNEMSQ